MKKVSDTWEAEPTLFFTRPRQVRTWFTLFLYSDNHTSVIKLLISTPHSDQLLMQTLAYERAAA